MKSADIAAAAPLRIGMDIAPLADSNLTGIPLYVESLLDAFARRADARETFVLSGNLQGRFFPDLLKRRGLLPGLQSRSRLVLSFDGRIGVHAPWLADGPAGWLTRKIDGRVMLAVNDWVERLAMRGPVDVFHHTSVLRVPLNSARRHIVTIYDLSTRLFPDAHLAVNIAAWERVFTFARERADLVIADSESARNDAIEHLGLSPDRVRAIPLAARASLLRESPATKADAEARLARFGLAPGVRFVLAVGTLEPRKNLPRLIEAFARLMAGNSNHKDALLVLTGSVNRGAAAIEEALKRHNLGEERVVRTGYVSDAELAALYQGCACFAYPSLYEGFGLPVLEAMALGAPVVTSNVSSLPEVAGDAALLVDPSDVDALAHALERVLSDDALAADLRSRGRLRAAQFSWERCADEHVRLYHEVAAA